MLNYCTLKHFLPRRLSREPTSKLKRKITKLIKATDWPDNVKSEVTPKSCVPPRFYGLPKIYKLVCPIRPIVNTINPPTYAVSKFLAGLLKPYVGKTEAYVKNSASLVIVLDSIKLVPMDLFVSLDVVSLYTNVPLQQTLQWLEPLFPTSVMALFQCVLTSTYFSYNLQRTIL